ncbi:MAG: reverse gyrase [Calditrichaeota bacterium]|nr:reverse gyrase [Calditrichota bacterium]
MGDSSIPVVYEQLCPVCGGALSHQEMDTNTCFHQKIPLTSAYAPPTFQDFARFFQQKTGFRLNPLQQYWAKKLGLGLSFAAMAPTGVGKTLFGLAYSAFLARRGKFAYVLVPTVQLLRQCEQRLREWLGEAPLLVFYARSSATARNHFFERLSRKDFRILLTTTAFLARHGEALAAHDFDFVFVDDVDAILKNSRNVDRVFQLLGFTLEEISRMEVLESRPRGQLMVSTATGKPGRKAGLFPRLLNFTVGSSRHFLRNVLDVLVPCSSHAQRQDVLRHLVRQLGKGGLIYAHTEAEALQLQEQLADAGIPSGCLISGMPQKQRDALLDQFRRGDLWLLLGVATSYGLLVRGIDLPTEVRYAVFWGIPHFRVGWKDLESASPRLIATLASVFRQHPELGRLSPLILRKPTAREQARELLQRLFRSGDFRWITGGVCVEENALILPDVSTYLQASGRTSRLFAGGLTRGAAFVLDTAERLEAFQQRARILDLEFQQRTPAQLTDTFLGDLRRELEDSRQAMRNARQSGGFDIRPALFVVESPTKARQVSRFFGTPAAFWIGQQPLYEVLLGNYLLIITASLGHLTDLSEGKFIYGVERQDSQFIPHFGSIKKCETDRVQFVDGENCPRCGLPASDDARHRLHTISWIAHLTGQVIVATDPDTEGEKIAWDVANFSKSGAAVYRAEFHEVTRSAILQALERLQSVDEKRVRAQLVRRISDRWIGFRLSKILQETYGDPNLSAGRAQTPVLSWIVDHFLEHRQKIRHFYLVFEGFRLHLGSEAEVALPFRRSRTVSVVIEKIDTIEETRSPLPPFSTDAILREASGVLKLPVQTTMQILQQLFENGWITYHRTDSTAVSDRGLQIAREFLKQDFVGRKWSDTPGAHECIRPTRPIDASLLRDLIYQGVYGTAEPFRREHFRLYQLIFQRFMASQCPPFKQIRVRYAVHFPDEQIRLEVERVESAQGRAVELYPHTVRVYPALPCGRLQVLLEVRKQSRRELLTPSEVIRLMKERGIGRPSTYAVILERLFRRFYVIERRMRLIPTRRGMDVRNFLMQRYAHLVSEERTRRLELQMDEVERGVRTHHQVLQEIYDELMALELEETETEKLAGGNVNPMDECQKG